MPRIQLSPNNRASCRRVGCKSKILKDTYRVGVCHSNYGRSTTHWYHVKCYPKSSGLRLPTVTLELVGYSKLPKKEKRKLRKKLWPNQVGDKKKPRIKLLKEINKMTVSDLKLELERRDLRRRGNKQELKDRLEQYLKSNKCKQQNNLLVDGYCRRIITKHKLNIPTYLQAIIHKYYPPYT